MKTKLSDLRKHVDVVRHVKASAPYHSARQSKIDFPKYTDTQRHVTSEAEVQLAMFVAEHTAFLTADHLAETCKKTFSDSVSVQNMKLHRTKCRQIIVNVLGPHFIESLQADIGEAKYNILIDESTDVFTVKLLGVTEVF